MKIAILTATLTPHSGIDRVVEQQAKKHIQAGDSVTILTFEATMEINGATIEIIGAPRNSLLERIYRLLFFLDVAKINRYAHSLKDFDEIHAYQYPMSIIASRAKTKYGVPFHYLNHGIAPAHTFETIVEKMYIRLITKLTNYVVRKADHVQSISKYLADVLRSETGVESTVTKELFNIDTDRFNREIDSTKIRKQYNIGNNPLILYVGRISPHKGIHLLLDAFELVRDKVPEAYLVIVGKQTFSTYQKKLKIRAGEHVIFTGFVEDQELPYYYSACDVYATATLWEGFDLPIVEAQAYGKPVVAFDLCAHPEVVDDRGILVEPKNIQQFADALLKQIHHEKK